MTRQLWLGLLLAGVLLARGPHAETAQRSGEPATGLLMGVIVDALDGQPVPNAQVTLGGAAVTSSPRELLTDADGRFIFMDLPKGTYTITATKPGYADGAYGRRRPMGLGQSLTLADSTRIGDLRIPIWKFAAITGRIVDEIGDPLVGIGVRVLKRTVVAGRTKLTPGATARTDDRGVYRIASLTPGDYVVVVASTQSTAPESVVDAYRQGRGGLGSTPGSADLYREFSFSGVTNALILLDRHKGAKVDSLAFLSTGGGVHTASAPMPSGSGRIHVYPTQYYPAASTSAEAATLTVRSGEERGGVDLQLRLTATSRVSGTVTGPDGPVMVALSLAPDSDDVSTEIGFEAATTLSDGLGRFTFLGVPPGRHQLRAVWLRVPPVGGASRGAPPPQRQGATAAPAPPPPVLGGFTLWAAQTITVGATDITDLAINVRQGFRISGRTEFTGTAVQPAPDVVRRITATLDPADARPLVSPTIGRGQFDDKGVLSTYELPPGRYYLRIPNAPPGWTLKSATVNGRDISNVPLMLDRDVGGVVITFTDRPSILSGQVTSAEGPPDPSATVLVFPADSGTWSDYGDFPRSLRAIRVGPNGRYQTSGLPAGEYLAVAIVDESTANWQDPAVLKALARLATPLTIGDGETRSLSLKTTAVRR